MLMLSNANANAKQCKGFWFKAFSSLEEKVQNSEDMKEENMHFEGSGEKTKTKTKKTVA